MIATMPGLTNSLGYENPSEEWMPNNIWNKFCDFSKLETRFGTIIKNFEKDEKIWK